MGTLYLPSRFTRRCETPELYLFLFHDLVPTKYAQLSCDLDLIRGVSSRRGCLFAVIHPKSLRSNH